MLTALPLKGRREADPAAKSSTDPMIVWTISAVAACHRVDGATGSTDSKDLLNTPAKVANTAKMVAGHTAHPPKLLNDSPYPG